VVDRRRTIAGLVPPDAPGAAPRAASDVPEEQPWRQGALYLVAGAVVTPLDAEPATRAGMDLPVTRFPFGVSARDAERVGLVARARAWSALLAQDSNAHRARDRPSMHATEKRLLTSAELLHVRERRGSAPPVTQRTANGRRAEGAPFVDLRGGATALEDRRERAKIELDEALMRSRCGPRLRRADRCFPHSSSPGSTCKMDFAKARYHWRQRCTSRVAANTWVASASRE